MTLLDETLPAVEHYVGQLSLPALDRWPTPARANTNRANTNRANTNRANTNRANTNRAGADGTLRVRPLAQGEYNLNYLVEAGGDPTRRWVLRVNIGTQIARDDQILYEHGALELLRDSGVTPRPYHVDDTRQAIPHGVLLMEYLPGEALDYRRDLDAAAALFARLHQHPVDGEDHHLVREEAPLAETLAEVQALLRVYRESELADPQVRGLLDELLAWAGSTAERGDRFFRSDPWPCVINTEVNSGNFIANRAAGTLHLVDWEKPLWGDPSQDLSHFVAATTTLWKTTVELSRQDKDAFIARYRAGLRDRHLADTIAERVALREPFNCLRGIGWSAMAWVRYQSGAHAVRNADTFRKVGEYLRPGFLRRLFADQL